MADEHQPGQATSCRGRISEDVSHTDQLAPLPPYGGASELAGPLPGSSYAHSSFSDPNFIFDPNVFGLHSYESRHDDNLLSRQSNNASFNPHLGFPPSHYTGFESSPYTNVGSSAYTGFGSSHGRPIDPSSETSFGIGSHGHYELPPPLSSSPPQLPNKRLRTNDWAFEDAADMPAPTPLSENDILVDKTFIKVVRNLYSEHGGHPPQDRIADIARLLEASTSDVQRCGKALVISHETHLAPKTASIGPRQASTAAHPQPHSISSNAPDIQAELTTQTAGALRYSHEHPVIRSYLREQSRTKCPPENQEAQQGRGSAGIYKCTRNCGASFKSKYSWQRHEWRFHPRELWICPLCPQSDPENPPHINYRRTKFRDHLEFPTIHRQSKSQSFTIANNSWIPIPLLRELHCGFGDYAFDDSHTVRDKHLEDHFKGHCIGNDVAQYQTDQIAPLPGRHCARVLATSKPGLKVGVDDPAVSEHRPSKRKAEPRGQSRKAGGKSSAAKSVAGTKHNAVEYCETMSYEIDCAMIDEHINVPGLLGLHVGHYSTQFKFVKTLGTGQHAQVDEVEVKSAEVSFTFALKSRNPSKDIKQARDHFNKEANTLKQLDHPNIIRMLSSSDNPSNPSLVVWPAADSDLAHCLEDPEAYKYMLPHEVIKGTVSLAAGLSYLHSVKLLHNDIKPTNILVKGTDLIFSDFGCSTKAIKHNSGCACPPYSSKSEYAAPEIRFGGHPSGKSDVYSLGMVFLHLIAAFYYRSRTSVPAVSPKPSPNDAAAISPRLALNTVRTVLKDRYKDIRGTLSRLMLRTGELCLAMIQRSPEDRPTASDVTSNLSRILHVMPPVLMLRRTSLDGVHTALLSAATESASSVARKPACPFLQSYRPRALTSYNNWWSIRVLRPHLVKSDLRTTVTTLKTSLPPDHAQIRKMPHQGVSTQTVLFEIERTDGAGLRCRHVGEKSLSVSIQSLVYAVFAENVSGNSAKSLVCIDSTDEWISSDRLPPACQRAVDITSQLSLAYIWMETWCHDATHQRGSDKVQFNDAISRATTVLITATTETAVAGEGELMALAMRPADPKTGDTLHGEEPGRVQIHNKLVKEWLKGTPAPCSTTSGSQSS